MKKLTIETKYSWLISCLSLVVYLICLPKSITFWDSSEFVISSFTLQNTHAPGAPFYTLVNAIVTGFFNNINAAYITNLMAATFGALTVKYLFNVIYFIADKITNSPQNKELSILPAIIGSLSFAFCSSFWRVSTETEVYTLSYFLLIFIFWLSLKWHEAADRNKETQFLFLIFLFLGISVGVHLINIAIVFPLTLLYFHKKIGFTLRYVSMALVAGILVFVLLFTVFFKGIIFMVFKIDFFTVNSLHFPVNLGALLGFVAILLLLLYTAYSSQKNNYIKLHCLCISLVLFLIGSSTYITSIVRSQIKTPTATVVKTPLALQSYINAEQFGVNNIPLINGHAFNAPLNNEIPFLNGPVKYAYNESSKNYESIDDGNYCIENYNENFKLFFPRMHHQSAINIEGYKTWTTIKGEPTQAKIGNKFITINKPTLNENVSFFVSYQINWLYLRYFFKNFIGSQNNLRGAGNIIHGNWKSGFNSIDKHVIGDESITPVFYKTINSNDNYYFLPFLLGLWGLFFLRKNKVYFYTTIALFITFGVGIIIYTNPVPKSILIRERDYIVIGSFLFFSVWIGLSVIGVCNLFKKITTYKISVLAAVILCFFVVPFQFLVKGFDNHNRAKDVFALELGKAYLKDCPKQAVLITNGDNLTFPLWYLQEVEKFRTDVRVVSYDQLALDWYVAKLKTKTNKSAPLHLKVSDEFTKSKKNEIITYKKQTEKYLNIKNIATFFNSSLSKTIWKGKEYYTIPTNKFLMPVKPRYTVNRFKAVELDTIKWVFSKQAYAKKDIILLDIIGNNINDRPILFTETGNNNHKAGLSPYLVIKGMYHQLLPLKRVGLAENSKIVDTELSYKNMILTSPFTKLNAIDSKINDENSNISKQVLRRNFYFLAQALLEGKDTLKAVKTIDFSVKLIPNKTIPFNEFAFSLGKLYYRSNKKEKGNEVCTIAINNIEDKIKWVLSFNPPRPIINVRYLNRLMKNYEQMIYQIKEYDLECYTQKQTNLDRLKKQSKKWQHRNWPY